MDNTFDNDEFKAHVQHMYTEFVEPHLSKAMAAVQLAMARGSEGDPRIISSLSDINHHMETIHRDLTMWLMTQPEMADKMFPEGG